MPSIRLTLTVSESVYEGFVLPKKQQKSLNRAVVGLMESYMSEEYVRAHIDGDLKHASQEAVSELKDQLKDVFNTTDQEIAFGSATARAGIEAMEREIEDASESEGASEKPGGVSQEENDAKFTAVNNRLDKLTSLLEALVVQGMPIGGATVAPTAPAVVSGSVAAGMGTGLSGGRVRPEADAVIESVDEEKTEVEEVPVAKPSRVVPPKAIEADDDAELGEDEVEIEEKAIGAILGFGMAFNVGGL